MLYQKFDDLKESFGENFFTSRVSEEIIQNLNPRFELREYQKEALGRFDFYFNGYQKKQYPVHLLFNMATGSGKTLIIAANILALYKLGYRIFIYFVHRNNILEKTRDNFLNPLSTKYLFSEKVIFNGKEVKIREIKNLSDVVEDDINIMFTTINALHERINKPKENALTEEDFEGKEVVLIADEAHHYQAYTKLKDKKGQQLIWDTDILELKQIKGLSEEEKEELRAWEKTIQEKILPKRNKNGESKNILLEYTATIDLNHPAIKEKYENKIIFKYDLVRFREEGYSKEIEVVESDIRNPMERALQAVVLSQYRRKIAEKNGLPLKPVILFKSKTIEESKRNELDFRKLIDNLTVYDLVKISQSVFQSIAEAFQYFKENDIPLENLVEELKNDFAPEKCLAVNSKQDSEEKQILVNSLEDPNNEIRAIFAVDMLNEGWDVLNLFDIVRLYETRDSRNNKPGKTTIAEAQLIGRGMRYWPFALNSEQDKYKRKFDKDISNPLRILEQLHYHCSYQPQYVSEIKKALVDIGAMEKQRREVEIKVKEEFKNTYFWKEGFIFLNELTKVDKTEFKSLEDFSVPCRHVYPLSTYFTHEEAILSNELDLKQDVPSYRATLKIKDLPENIVRFALDKNKFYYFDNLKRFIPGLRTIKDFYQNDNWLGGIEIEFVGKETDIEMIRRKDVKIFPALLGALITVLNKISQGMIKGNKQFRGSKKFYAEEIKKKLRDKIITFDFYSSKINSASEKMRIGEKKWYAQNEFWGTGLELDFLKQFDNDYYQRLQAEYDDIILIRNEQFWAIYNFEDGQAFYPDFVLFLRKKNNQKIEIKQIFIEPKDDIYIKNEPWKQELIQTLEQVAMIEWETPEYKILSLPFYNARLKYEFEEMLKAKLLKNKS
ncbi:MAG: Type III restriction-modification system DNA endonuclease res [Candidatus Kapaibacterium sp.]|nr:MAG: Type III restriction-modification system DNA endonuclease res [Candidatus Kapabacteria bacterium]